MHTQQCKAGSGLYPTRQTNQPVQLVLKLQAPDSAHFLHTTGLTMPCTQQPVLRLLHPVWQACDTCRQPVLPGTNMVQPMLPSPSTGRLKLVLSYTRGFHRMTQHTQASQAPEPCGFWQHPQQRCSLCAASQSTGHSCNTAFRMHARGTHAV